MQKIIADNIESLFEYVKNKGKDLITCHINRKQAERLRYKNGMACYSFESDLWLDYFDIIVRIEAEISAIRFCIFEIEGREKDRYTRQNLIMSFLKRGADFLDLKRQACQFMKVGEN